MLRPPRRWSKANSERGKRELLVSIRVLWAWHLSQPDLNQAGDLLCVSVSCVCAAAAAQAAVEGSLQS